MYLRVQGKGRKVRAVPLFTDVVDALELWREQRDRIPELADDPWLFPRLGRQRRDGSFPDAGGRLSTTAVIRIVRPTGGGSRRRLRRPQLAERQSQISLRASSSAIIRAIATGSGGRTQR